jgi:hypothetical protein
MSDKSLSRLSVGITYRFDMKKALLSQLGAMLALVVTIISDDHPPFGDEPYKLLSPTTVLLLVNLGLLVYTIISFGASTIKLFPSMLIYNTRRKQIRLDFGRVTRIAAMDKKNIDFYINDSFGKETRALRIKNYAAYAKSDEMLKFLKYLLRDKFTIGSFISNLKMPSGKSKFRLKK